MDIKVCGRCKAEKPIDQFSKAKGRKDGLYSYCKTCDSIYQKEKRDRSEVHLRAVAKRQYYEEHREELTKARQDRANRSEKSRANHRRYMKTEKYKAYKRHYLHSPKGRQHTRAYVETRRAKKLNNGGSYTPEEWMALCAFYDYRCLACGQQFPFETLTVDHVIPLSVGGTSNIDNLQPLCKPCNCSKHDSIIDYRTRKIWWQQLPLL